MRFDQNRLRNDLQDLADLPTAPVDPTPEIHRRVRGVRRRRTAGVAVLAASAVAAVALVAGPTLGAIRSTGSEPGYAGSPRATNTTRGTPSSGPTAIPTTPPPSFRLPEPWSDRKFTKEPERNIYRPIGYYVDEGRVQGRDWGVLAFSDDGTSPGCLAVEPQEAFDPYFCYNYWPAGRRANWSTANAHAGPKPNPDLLPATLVMGAVSVEARTVDIKVAGKLYHADAVGTPASNRLRFFAIVVPVVDASPGEVTPRMANGDVAPPPVGLPANTDPCAGGNPGDCTEAQGGPDMPKSSETKASGPGYEEYVPGEQGTGYLVNDGDGASAVSYRKNGDGAACLAAEPNETYVNTVLCYGDHGEPSGDGVLWKEIPGSNGTKVVMGMLIHNGLNHIELLNANGKRLGTVSAVQTPTTSQALFFMTVLSKDADVSQVKAVR
ncbi:hypothetical protein [Flindersiella endophytica]